MASQSAKAAFTKGHGESELMSWPKLFRSLTWTYELEFSTLQASSELCLFTFKPGAADFKEVKDLKGVLEFRRMPKSYELKLREAEERRRKPEQQDMKKSVVKGSLQDTIYKAIEGKSQKSLDCKVEVCAARIMLGFDHPESLQFEMQLTWVEDTWTATGMDYKGRIQGVIS